METGKKHNRIRYNISCNNNSMQLNFLSLFLSNSFRIRNDLSRTQLLSKRFHPSWAVRSELDIRMFFKGSGIPEKEENFKTHKNSLFRVQKIMIKQFLNGYHSEFSWFKGSNSLRDYKLDLDFLDNLLLKTQLLERIFNSGKKRT